MYSTRKTRNRRLLFALTLATMCFILIGFFPGDHAVQGQLLSDFINNLETNIAGGDPIPDNLFDTSGLNPFSHLTINGGDDTLAAVWQQTVIIEHFGTVNVGLLGTLPQQVAVFEENSQFQFYESSEQTFVTSGDPFVNSQFDMNGPMGLNIVDADDSADGIQAFINDVPEVPLDPGTEIAVWEGQPIAVEIVALTLIGVQPIAVNTMVPFQFVGDDGSNVLDNAFGIFESDWTLPLGADVLLDDGQGNFVPSPFLEEWKDMPQYRWKGHPSGWVMVVTGAPLPGPAGIIHSHSRRGAFG